MSVALYMDENVHRGITDGLRIRNVKEAIALQADHLDVSTVAVEEFVSPKSFFKG